MGALLLSAQRTKWCLSAIIWMSLLIFSTPTIWANPDYVMEDFESIPITIVENSVKPQVQINASNDHQLYFKAYNDYSDLDDDKIPETTYKHSIDYYGYFDSKKCYTYSTTRKRFEPSFVSSDKYCNAETISNEWSGNFLNWASMTRIDAIRKILFGGHRRVDTKDETVLERAFIPPDIHAFAKYYNGVDLPKLTPFSVNSAPVSKSSTTPQNITTGSKVFSTDSSAYIVGDYVVVTSKTDPEQNFMSGWVTASQASQITVDIKDASATAAGNIPHSDWNIANLTRTGITLCNVTYSSTSNYSEFITDPPLIRVASGNYAFWAAGEVHQCLWEDEDIGGNGKNYNNPEYSGIPAAQDNPYKTERLGPSPTIDTDYVARVVACKDLNGDGKYDDSDGFETCKRYYPNLNLKPTGLLQEYGEYPDEDPNGLLFGMIAGTYGKSTLGGDMIMPLFMKNNGANNMCREINLGRDCDGDGTIDDLVDTTHAMGDGTFKKVFTFVGGPASKQDAAGVINAWSIYRIKGYQYGSGKWNYNSNSGDKCPLGIKFFGESSSSECKNWVGSVISLAADLLAI